jgi:hypothetical protein
MGAVRNQLLDRVRTFAWNIFHGLKSSLNGLRLKQYNPFAISFKAIYSMIKAQDKCRITAPFM